MNECPYLEYLGGDNTSKENKCSCKLAGCLMSADDLMVQLICSSRLDYGSCNKYKENAANRNND